MINVDRSSFFGKILTVSIISVAIAFSPALLFQFGSEADTTGTGAYVFLFLFSIPAGLVVFVTGIISSINYYRNSLSDSEKKQLGLDFKKSSVVFFTHFSYLCNIGNIRSNMMDSVTQ